MLRGSTVEKEDRTLYRDHTQQLGHRVHTPVALMQPQAHPCEYQQRQSLSTHLSSTFKNPPFPTTALIIKWHQVRISPLPNLESSTRLINNPPKKATQFEVAQPPDDAVSRVVFAPESSTRLLASSWDKNVYLYEIEDADAASASLVRQFEHRAPVMDVCFGASDNEAFTAGMDHRVMRYAMRDTTG